MTVKYWTPEKKRHYKELLDTQQKSREYHREYNKKSWADGRIPSWRDVQKLKALGINTSGLNKAEARKLVKINLGEHKD